MHDYFVIDEDCSYDLAYMLMLDAFLEKGVWVKNKRTNSNCLTLPPITFKYTENILPLLRSKWVNWEAATAEIIGYINGYSNAQDFADLGAKTWFANANENEAWLNNPHRKGENDMGKVYGAIARDFGGVDLIEKVITNLKNGVDDRGEIITFWKPDDFDKGCLRPCLHTHNFSLVGDTLHLTSHQRSGDVPLGVVWNSWQCWWLLSFMCKITDKKFGGVTHIINNPHIYENQIKGILEQRQNHKNMSKNHYNDFMVYLTDYQLDVDYVDKKVKLHKHSLYNYDKSRMKVINFPFTT